MSNFSKNFPGRIQALTTGLFILFTFLTAGYISEIQCATWSQTTRTDFVEKGQDSIDRSHINLFVTSINYRLTPRLDILTEGRYIYLHETGDWKLGSSIEVGYRPIKDLRLGLGYTFTEYDDGDQAHDDQDYLSRGPYIKITISPSF